MRISSSIIHKLEIAKTPEDKAAIIADFAISQLPKDLAKIIRSSIIFHWLDEDIIKSILPKKTKLVAEDVLISINKFPFVDNLPWGIAYHQSTRRGLLRMYKKNYLLQMRQAAKKAVSSYLKKADKKSFLEAIYCLQVTGDNKKVEELWKKMVFKSGNEDWQLSRDIIDLQEDIKLILPKQNLYLPLFAKKERGWYLIHPYPMPPNFTGRKTECNMLDEWLNNDKKNKLLIIRAIGGFGKSSLTWHWLTQIVSPKKWKKVVFWSFYEGDASFDNFVREILDYFGAEISTSSRERVDKLLKIIQSQKSLIIMDGFERALRAYGSLSSEEKNDWGLGIEENYLDCIDINANVFLKRICSLPNMKSKVLMTTRLTPRVLNPDGIYLEGCREEELTSIDKADAVQFFRSSGVLGSKAEIEDICAVYGYHPLSLRLLVGLIASDTKKPYDISVAQKINITNDIYQNKKHILEQSYQSLSKIQKTLLWYIACFRFSISYKDLKSIVEKNKDFGSRYNNFDDDLETIKSRGILLWESMNNKYDLHPIVRLYIYNQIPEIERVRIHSYLSEYFSRIDLLSDKAATNLDTVIELYYHTIQSGRLEEAFGLFKDYLSTPLYYQLGAYQKIIELLSAFFINDIDSLPNLKDESAQAWVLSFMSLAYSSIGQPNQAILLTEQSLLLHRKTHEDNNYIIELTNLSSNQIKTGNFHFGEKNLRRSIDLSLKTQNLWEAVGHQKLGYLLSYCGRWDESEQELDFAYKTFYENNDIQSQCVTLSYYALRSTLLLRDGQQIRLSSEIPVANNINNIKFAIQFAKQALALVNRMERNTTQSNIRDFVRSSWLLGAMLRLDGDLTASEYYLLEGLSRVRAVNMIESEADILLDLARLRYDQKNYEESKSLVDEALIITERCGYVLQGADVNLFLSQYALEQEKDKVKAKEYAETALKLAYCDGPPYYYKVAYHEAEAMLEKLK